MPDHRSVYLRQAATYDALVRREDWQGNLPNALAELLPLSGARVCELGAGSGRVTELLVRAGAQVFAFDGAAAMLAEAGARFPVSEPRPGLLALADNSALPLASSSVDLVVEGWSVAHQVGWFPQTWPQRVRAVLEECERVLRPGGALLFIETLGTGSSEPEPPAKLVPFYEWLEQRGFERRWIRTDYRFETPEEAASLVGAFFGPELVEQMAGARELPECTGLWLRRGR